MIIRGKEIADQKLLLLAEQVKNLKTKNIKPFLAIIIVGADPASQIYVRNKAMDAEKIGIKTQIFELPSGVSEVELLRLIESINKNNLIHGVIIQLPLPAHLSKRKILNTVSPNKDVDGFHSLNVGFLYTGEDTGFVSCTPMGCLQIIKSQITDLSGMHAVIVGRSEIVGRPMASLLLRENCTVTICHSATRNLKEITKLGDIVVTAIGKPNFFDLSYFKPEAFLVDVGINRVEQDGVARLVGDINANVTEYVKYITPVPGGVGPMTRACLLENTIRAALLPSLREDL
jgi:methylenetetrahydrofolate dehydrogenase (NADP+)/methenyltetrahydrofolate cyclohydrolase